MTVRSDGTMSPPAKMPATPVIMLAPTWTTPSFTSRPGNALQQRQIDILAEREHDGIRLQGFEFAGRLRKALVVERHLLDRDRSGLDVLDRRQPLHHHALFDRLLDLEVVGRHPVAGAAIDDDGFLRAEPLGGARDVERGIAAAIDHDLAPQQRLLLALHRAQHRHGIQHLGRLAGRNIGALGDVGADREKRRVEAAIGHRLLDVGDLGVVVEDDAEVGDALDFGIQHIARQAIFRNPEPHHAARRGTGFLDRHGMAEPRQMIGGRQSRRPGADHQHLFARGRGGRGKAPAAPDGEIAEEPLHRIDADGGIEHGAIAGALAGVIADPPHDGGQRIVFGQRAPGRLVVAAFGDRPASPGCPRPRGRHDCRAAGDAHIPAAACARSRCD